MIGSKFAAADDFLEQMVARIDEDEAAQAFLQQILRVSERIITPDIHSSLIHAALAYVAFRLSDDADTENSEEPRRHGMGEHSKPEGGFWSERPRKMKTPSAAK
jgi:hypothetical protein